MQIKTRLKELMKANRLSAPKLANRSGVPLPSIKSILSGQSKNPRATTLQALATSLNCEIDDLLSETPVLPASPQESLDDSLFKAAIDMVEQVAAEQGISLENRHDFKRKCVERVFAYAMEKNKSGQTVVDKVYAEWVVLSLKNS